MAEHQFVDFGDDQYTQGRAHPMIDPTLRNHAIVEAGADPRVAVVLLDVILGLGSHADPAGATVPAVREAVARAATADGRQQGLTVRSLHVVGHRSSTGDRACRHPRSDACARAETSHVLGSNYHAAVPGFGLLLRGRIAT